jgi:integrase
VPQLALRVTKGAKAFIFETRLSGKKLRTTIGAASTWDIEAARGEARRLQTMVDQGIDPRDAKAEQAEKKEAKRTEREAQKAEADRQKATVGNAWAQYLEARRPRWGDAHYQDHLKLARPGGEPTRKRGGGVSNAGPLASLMPLRLSDLGPEQIQTWLEGEAAVRPTASALAYRLFRPFLNWCSERPEYRGLADPSAVLTRDVRESVPAPQVKADCLQREQIKPWFDSVRQHANPVIPAYLQTLFLTGARREELATLTWDKVDFQWSSLTIRDKVVGERTIPLTPYVATLLAALPRRNQWVFSSPTAKSGRIQEPRIAHNRALEAAGLAPLTLHGLRRSFGTLAEWVEVPTGIVAQIQGHKPSALAEKHYRRRPLDLLRQWHTRLEEWILAEAGIVQPSVESVGAALRRVK